MNRKLLFVIFVITIAFSQTTFSQPLNHRPSLVIQSEKVRNLDTGINYTTIQEAINAPETDEGHTIFVEEGIYYENVIVNKSISVLGEDKSVTVVDGNGTGTAITITHNNVTITGFMIQRSGSSLSDCGVYLDHASNCNISGNNIADNYNGVYLYGSSDNIVSRNNVTGNDYDGISLQHSSKNDISGNNMADNYNGVYFYESSDNTISRNNITENKLNGVYLSASSGNIVSRNNIIRNTYDGICIQYSSKNGISKNDMANNLNGVYFYESSDNTISQNNMANSVNGVYLYGSSDNIVSRNNITGNTYDGIYFFRYSDCNMIFENNIANNLNGIYPYRSSHNTIFHNNFINNTNQVLLRPGDANAWDDGVPSGGNYWSNYTGDDLDHDGIGDSWHEIDENNIDHYPLMGMFSSFNTSYGCAVDFVSNSSISGFSFNLSPIEVYPPEAILAFDVSGETGTEGFLRVCIPKVLINGSYVIMFDYVIITTTTWPQVRELPCSSETYEYLYINYTHSEHAIIITGTTTIPEFPLFLILPLFMIATLLAAIIHRKRLLYDNNQTRDSAEANSVCH